MSRRPVLDSSKGEYINTHGAADNGVLVRMPANVPDAGIVAGQFGDHSTRQHIINCKDAQDYRIIVLWKRNLNPSCNTTLQYNSSAASFASGGGWRQASGR